MIRGLLIVFGVIVGLLAAIAAVFALGMHRISAAQREADAQWHVSGAAASQPADAAADDPAPTSQPDITSIELWAKDATLHGGVKLMDPGPASAARGRVDAVRNDRAARRAKMLSEMSGHPVTARLTNFHNNSDSAEWAVQIPKAGEYEIDAAYACPKWSKSEHFLIKLADQTFPLTPESTRSENNFRVATIGKLTLKAGNFTLVLSPDVHTGDRVFFNLRCIELIPAS